MAHLSAIPDPRSKRGQRYEWSYLLALVAVALLAGQQGLTAMASWLGQQRTERITLLQPRRGTVPSYATLRRLLLCVDVAVVEARVAAFTQALDGEETVLGRLMTAQGEVLQAQALDGKSVRGASAYGESVHLVSLVRHGSGAVLGQQRVASKIDERKAAKQLLAGALLAGTVTTTDALHTQVRLAQQIVDGGGHYLMVVKPNQPRLYREIAEAFSVLPPANRLEEAFWAYQQHQQPNQGHGRREQRMLESTTALNGYLHFPAVGQVLRRTCWRQVRRTGIASQTTHFGITSLRRNQVALAQLEQLWRGHWTIENGSHYVRDVSLAEDACKVHSGSAPQVLAALRNALVSLLRHEGWAHVPNGCRHFQHHLQLALQFIGALAT